MVFMSYSHDSDELCNKALELSNYLRSQGVDCNIDQYEESPTEGWPRWMEQQIRTAEYVLVACTRTYYSKATLQTHADTGLGVKWETNMILNHLYAAGTVTSKFIPVVFGNADVGSILDPLKGQTYYDVSHLERKEALRNRLLGIRQDIKPPLGSISPVEERAPKPDARLLITGVIDLESWNKARWTGVGYLFDFRRPPYLCFYHKDLASSLKIFADWRDRFGEADLADEIYISIIEEDDSPSYSVHIGANLDAVRKRLHSGGVDFEFQVFLLIDRWHRMTIVDKKYLEAFKTEFNRHQCYYICPIKQEGGKIVPIFDLSIRKNQIRFRKLSEVVDKETDYDYLAHNIKDEPDKE